MRLHTSLVALAALLVACGPPDADGDGFDNTVDCDDENNQVFPGAFEKCDDGLDSDCSGEDNDDYAAGGVVFFVDGDGDGFGSAIDTVVTCLANAPEGYVQDADDCDDADGTVYPGADEVCDGLDNDCNDFADDNPTDGETFFADRDRDGYGNDNETAAYCEPLEGWVREAGDCNDFNVYINPDGIERCDFEDNNCDGFTDESTAVDASPWWPDVDGDGFGSSVEESMQMACYQPENYLPDNTDCDDDESLRNPGVDEICRDGLDNNCNELPDQCTAASWLTAADATVVIEHSAGSYGGEGGPGIVGDFDDDGIDDLLTGNSYANHGGRTNEGAAYLLYGDTGVVDGNVYDPANDFDAIFTGGSCPPTTYYSTTCYAYVGNAIAGVGDLDGDGIDDFVVGAPAAHISSYSSFTSYIGQVHVVYGESTRYSGTLESNGADSATLQWSSSDLKSSSDYFGSGVTGVGDVNDDGYDDFIFGVPGRDYYGSSYSFYSGAVVLVYGGATRLADGDTSYVSFHGEYYDRLGGMESYSNPNHAMAGGDYNGDGISEFAAGAPYYDSGSSSFPYHGRVYIWEGHTTKLSGGLAKDTADTYVDNDSPGGSYDYMGTLVDLSGDVDNDGYNDMLIGSYGRNSYAGEIGILYGGSTGLDTTNYSDAETVIKGGNSYDYFGRYGGVGYYDFSGDGVDDLVLGHAYADDETGQYSTGAVHVFYGGDIIASGDTTDADHSIYGEGQYHYMGWSNFGTGDLNGDGLEDFYTSAYGANSYDGVDYVFLGTGI